MVYISESLLQMHSFVMLQHVLSSNVWRVTLAIMHVNAALKKVYILTEDCVSLSWRLSKGLTRNLEIWAMKVTK